MNLRFALISTLGWALAAQVGPRLEMAQAIPVVDTLPEDPELARVIAPLAQEIQAIFGRELANCPSGLVRGRGGEENLLGYWVADLMRERAQQMVGVPVKFAITNAGGLRGDFRPGRVKIRDIYEVMPFENEMMVAEYSGAEVIQMVKDGILHRAGEPCSGIRAKVLGTPEKPECTITWSDGSPIDPKETVNVALTDYLLSSGDGISVLSKGRRVISTGLPLRDLLIDACIEMGRLKAPLVAPGAQRFILAPAIRQAIRDKKLKW